MATQIPKVSKHEYLMRPRHNLTRSISEMTPLTAPRQNHRSHHHPHLHRKDKDEKSPASALPNLQTEGLNSEGVTPNGSHSGSRRASLLGPADEEVFAVERRVVAEGVVNKEREKSAMRAKELSKSLGELNTISNDTTRRLDNTYYSVLEKLSSFQSTISSLKELAQMTRNLNDRFKVESQEVVGEIETQLGAFEGFKDQEATIQKLQARIQAGREKVKVLGDRVEVTRHKVEGWEKIEGEWQQRVRKRIKILWVVIAVVALLLVGLLIFQYSPSRTMGPGVMKGFNASDISATIRNLEGEVFNESLHLKRSALHALDELRRGNDEPLGDDPRLRPFDEL